MNVAHERRAKGMQFHRDEDDVHWTSMAVKTYKLGIAFVVQLAALCALIWGLMEMKITPLIDQRIDARTATVLDQTRANSDWIIAHTAEVKTGIARMNEYSEQRDREKREVLDELRYIRGRVDELYAKMAKVR